MAVDYTPQRGPFKNLKDLRFWCQKVLPLVYDDSLSYYEVLGKLTAKLNEVIAAFNNEISAEVIDYIQSEEFSEWLKTYIESRKIELHSLAIIGDSNAAGFGWWRGNVADKTLENDGYAAVLRELYPDAVIDNYAVSGALLRGETGNVGKIQCDQLIESGKSYEYIIIQLGWNDLGFIMNSTDNVIGYCPDLKSSAVNTVDYSTCVKALITIINRLKSYLPDARIIYLCREYQAAGAAYLYPMYQAAFKQIFETCYLMNVPILNLETNFINSAQQRKFYYDAIHWNEAAYREYVTPRIIAFLTNPISSGLIGKEYLFLCCSLTDIIRGDSGNNYAVNTALKTALDYIRTDSPYLSFSGSFILTNSPGSFMFGSITCINPFLLAKLRRGLHDQNFTVFINNDNTTEFYIDNTSIVPTISGNTSYSGAEYQLDNITGYGVIPGGQTVFHEAYNDNRGNLTRLITGARIGEMITVYNPESGARNDFYRGGMLGVYGPVSLQDDRVQSGVYYVPAYLTPNITLGVPAELLGSLGYTLIVNKQIANPGLAIYFAFTVTGVYYMLNNDGVWVKCAGV